MNQEKETHEKCSADFRKLKFDLDNPGKETRKTLALIGGIVIAILLVVFAGCYALRVNNALSAGIVSSVVTIGGIWARKGRGSP